MKEKPSLLGRCEGDKIGRQQGFPALSRYMDADFSIFRRLSTSR